MSLKDTTQQASLEFVADKNAISKLVPHKPPMLLIDKLLETKKDQCVAETFINNDNPFLKKRGIADETIFPELIAQSALVHDAWQNQKKKETAYITGFEDIQINRPAKLGEILTIRIKTVSQFENLYRIEGIVSCLGEELASGKVIVWK